MRGLLSKWFAPKSQKPAGPRFQPAVEALEERRLMSYSVLAPVIAPSTFTIVVPATSYLSAGNLVIQGSSISDAAEVSELTSSKDGSVAAYRVELNGSVRDYNAADVSGKIHFYGRNGSDSFKNNTGLRAMAWGEEGHDSLIGGRHNDFLVGGTGNDRLEGRAGNDQLLGADDNDYLYGNEGDDSVYGDNGWDQLFGGWGNDKLYGGEGVDLLEGSSAADAGAQGYAIPYITYLGSSYPDLSSVPAGLDDDTLEGGNGQDFLEDWGGGNDSLSGGADRDTLRDISGNNTLHGGQGDDRLEGSGYLFGDEDNDTLYGSVHNDKLFGGDGQDRLYGQDGEDHLFGGNGDDYLDGGHDGKRDYLWGDAGADSFRSEGYHTWLFFGKERELFGDFSAAAGDQTVFKRPWE